MTYYKYWVFYILPKYYEELEYSIPIIINTDTFIYAYTDNKDYADMFESMHNMKYLSRKKFDMTRDQVHELTLTERNKYMTIKQFATKSSVGATSIDLVVTLEELYSVEEAAREMVMKYSIKQELINPSMFSNELRMALKKMRYMDFWAYQNGFRTGSPFDYTTFKVGVDELAIYTNLFGVLLKDGENL